MYTTVGCLKELDGLLCKLTYITGYPDIRVSGQSLALTTVAGLEELDGLLCKFTYITAGTNINPTQTIEIIYRTKET